MAELQADEVRSTALRTECRELRLQIAQLVAQMPDEGKRRKIKKATLAGPTERLELQERLRKLKAGFDPSFYNPWMRRPVHRDSTFTNQIDEFILGEKIEPKDPKISIHFHQKYL